MICAGGKKIKRLMMLTMRRGDVKQKVRGRVHLMGGAAGDLKRKFT